MNGHRLEERDLEELALNEAMLAETFAATALQPSERQLADLATAAARLGDTARAPAAPVADPGRRWGRRWGLALALAAALALMASAGWYASATDSASGLPDDGVTAAKAAPVETLVRPVKPAPAPEQEPAAAAVAGWDDLDSQLLDEAGVLAMIDDDPLAAFDGWSEEDDLLATGAMDR